MTEFITFPAPVPDPKAEAERYAQWVHEVTGEVPLIVNHPSISKVLDSKLAVIFNKCKTIKNNVA